jgi:hypothetical protein
MKMKGLLRIRLVLVLAIINVCFPTSSLGFTELDAIQFKAGHPLPSESIAEAVDDPPEEQMQILRSNLDVLANASRIRVEIMGFTDSHECAASDCLALSLRRAKCVYDWLVAHGVPESKLKGPTGNGSEWPIDRSNMSDGWRYNRRVQFDFVAIDQVH